MSDPMPKPKSRADDWAVVVGIGHYHSSNLADLEGPPKDASLFRDWLLNPKGGNLSPERVLFCTSDDFPPETMAAKARPKRDDITERFETIFDDLTNRNVQGRRIYVYFSGHGCSPTQQNAMRNAALFMANAAFPRSLHNFPGSLAAEYLRSVGFFREVVLIMDCCRDAMNNTPLLLPWCAEASPDGRTSKLVQVFSTQWDSKAREREIDGQPGKRGIFTHSLLAVLNSGRIAGTTLKASVNEHLASSLAPGERRQAPDIDGDLEDLVFSEAAPPPATPVQFVRRGEPIAGCEILLQTADSFVPVQDWQDPADSARGRLAPGSYLLKTPSGMKPFRVLAAVPLTLEVPQ